MAETTRAKMPASSAEASPTITTLVCHPGTGENAGKNRARTYTPALTMVAAWISALIGVGASIASGSQVWNGTWADLAAAAASTPNAIKARVGDAIEPA